MSDTTKVFVGGSRRLSRLSKDVMRRLDRAMDKGLTILVGDANGADKALQRYLASKRYNKVIVYCMVGRCRNNLGNWKAREIIPDRGLEHGFAYYSTKDRAMSVEADYALMLWDGKSRGTLTNISDLIHQKKPVVVYLAPSKSLVTLREPNELEHLMDRLASVSSRPPARSAPSSTSHQSRDRLLF